MGWKVLAAGTSVPFTRRLCHRAKPRWHWGQRDTPPHTCWRAPGGASTSPASLGIPAHRPAPGGLPELSCSLRLRLGPSAHLAGAKGAGGLGPGPAGRSRLGLQHSPGGGGQRRGWLRPAQQSSSFISSPAFLSLAPATLSPLRSSEESSEAPGTQVTRHAASVTHGTPSPAPESHAASGRASGQRDTPAPSLPWAELELDGMREPLALKSPPLQQPWAQGRCWRTEASRGGGSAQGTGDCQRTEVRGAGAKWRVG